MKVQLKLTRVGMNMEEASIVQWLKKPGEAFSAGETLYIIETEKVSQEVTAPGSGTMVEIRVPEGDVAQVGDVVCVVDTAVN